MLASRIYSSVHRGILTTALTTAYRYEAVAPGALTIKIWIGYGLRQPRQGEPDAGVRCPAEQATLRSMEGPALATDEALITPSNVARCQVSPLTE